MNFFETIQYLSDQADRSRRMSYMGAAGVSDSKAGYGEWGVSDQMGLTAGPGTAFFGGFGPLIAANLGLVATGMNGLPSPVFTTDLGFGGVDRSLSMDGMARARANTELYMAMSAQSMAPWSSMAAGLVSPNSLFGRMAYRKDANGRYVHPGFAQFMDATGEFMRGPWGSALVSPFVQQMLGYDWGAGAGVVQGRIASVVSGLSRRGMSDFPVNGLGSPVDEEAMNREMAVISSGLENTRANFMYRNGFKRYDTTYGLGDAAVAGIMADLMQGGAYDNVDAAHAVMSDADRALIKGNGDAGFVSVSERRENSLRYREELRYKRARLAMLEKKGSKEPSEVRETERLRRETAHLEAMIKENDRQADDIIGRTSTYDFGKAGISSVADAYREMDRHQKNADEAAKNAARLSYQYDWEMSLPGASEGRLQDLRRQVEEQERIAASEKDEVGLIGRAVEGLVEEKTKSVTRLVGAMKSLFGSDENAAQAMRSLMGNAYAGPGGKELADAVAANVIGIKAMGRAGGIGDRQIGIILSEASSVMSSDFVDQDAMARGFGRDATTTLMAVAMARNEVGATAGLAGDEASRAHAGQRWREGNAANSDMTRAAYILESAREDGTIGMDDYESIRSRMQSGNRVLAGRALDELLRRRFGSVSRGRDMMANGAYMETVRRGLSVAGGRNAVSIMDMARFNEDLVDILSFRGHGKWAAFSSALEDAGADSDRVGWKADEAELDNIVKVLSGGSGNEYMDETALRLVREKYSVELERNGGDVNAARAATLSFFHDKVKNTLSDSVANALEKGSIDMRAGAAEAEFNAMREARADVAGKAFDMMEDLSSGEQLEAVSRLRGQYAEAMRSGDYRRAAALGRQALRLFGPETAKIIADRARKDAEEVVPMGTQETDAVVAWMEAKGMEVNPYSLQYYSNAFRNGVRNYGVVTTDEALASFDKDTAEFKGTAVEQIGKALVNGDVGGVLYALKNSQVSDEEYWKFLASGTPIEEVKKRLVELNPAAAAAIEAMSPEDLRKAIGEAAESRGYNVDAELKGWARAEEEAARNPSSSGSGAGGAGNGPGGSFVELSSLAMKFLEATADNTKKLVDILFNGGNGKPKPNDQTNFEQR